MKAKRIGIVGGGLAGLSLSILLQRKGYEVTVFERKTYPFHRVCGEYISNEVRGLVKHLGIDLEEIDHAEIGRLHISDTKGRILSAELDLGGFGISRFVLDELLYKQALIEGVQVQSNTKVSDIRYRADHDDFLLNANEQEMQFDFVIGTFGKRSTIDAERNRFFMKQRSPYIGVKYHVKIDFPDDLIQLDNFIDGYCGISKIETDRYCMCYLSNRNNLRRHGTIAKMEKEVLFQNPEIKKHFESSEFLYSEPLVINEISFERKELVQDHLLYCGDAAGMITPLCGNGMSMAVHAAYILSCSFPFADQEIARAELERNYESQWNATFSQRLWWGRTIQKFFGAAGLTNTTLGVLRTMPILNQKLISLTHGKVVQL